MTDLGALGGGSSAAAAINARGQVAGVSTAVAGKVNHAVLWDNGKIIDLGTLGNGASTIDYSNAFALNDAGQVTGESHTGNAFHGFLWIRAPRLRQRHLLMLPQLPLLPCSSRCSAPDGSY